MNTEKRLYRYAKTIRSHYGSTHLIGLAPGMAGVPDHEFHLVDGDTDKHFIVFDLIDPVRIMEYYDEPDEDVQIIVDADALPEEDRKRIVEPLGIPAVALAAAVMFGADILHKGLVAQVIGVPNEELVFATVEREEA